jgi:hypothetical protein
MRARNPWVRARFKLPGWKVRFIFKDPCCGLAKSECAATRSPWAKVGGKGTLGGNYCQPRTPANDTATRLLRLTACQTVLRNLSSPSSLTSPRPGRTGSLYRRHASAARIGVFSRLQHYSAHAHGQVYSVLWRRLRGRYRLPGLIRHPIIRSLFFVLNGDLLAG